MALGVIGAGFGRTGTASLKLALERLGFGVCHHMSEVMPDPARVALWTRIGRGEAAANPGLWDEAFDGYGSTVDWPACTHWRALMAHYPDAKVVLSRRDAGKWFESVHSTILAPSLNVSLAASPLGPMLEGNVWSLFDGRMDDRAHMMECFEAHNAEVVRSVPEGRLLVFDARDGWGPLCGFLGVAVPDEPYPHVNTKEETARVMAVVAERLAGGAQAAEAGFADDLYRERGGV